MRLAFSFLVLLGLLFPASHCFEELGTINFFDKIKSAYESGDESGDEAPPKTWLVEFYLPWDYYSKRTASLWQELERKHGDLGIGRIHLQKNQRIAEYMGVDSSRTILMLKEGRVWRWQGEPEIQDLKEEIENQLGASSRKWKEAPSPLSLSSHLVHFLTHMSFQPRYWVDLLINATGMEMFVLASSLFILMIIFLTFFVGDAVEKAPAYSELRIKQDIKQALTQMKENPKAYQKAREREQEREKAHQEEEEEEEEDSVTEAVQELTMEGGRGVGEEDNREAPSPSKGKVKLSRRSRMN